MKIYLTFLIILILLSFIIKQQQDKINYQEKQITSYQKNEHILANKIKDIYNEKIILKQQTEELKKASTKDSFDWNRDISNTYVIKQLQKN